GRGRLTLVEIQVYRGTAPELSVARDRFRAFWHGLASNGGAALRHFCHAIHLSPISSGLTETGHHDDVASLLLLPRRCHIVAAGQGQGAQRGYRRPALLDLSQIDLSQRCTGAVDPGRDPGVPRDRAGAVGRPGPVSRFLAWLSE